MGAHALWLVTIAACVSAPQPPDADASHDGCAGQALIDGAIEGDERWGAVVALGTRDEHGAFHLRCSATLVSARWAVTAKHCVWTSADASNSLPALFVAFGSDADAPMQLVPVDGIRRAAPDTGGVAELGSDVALVHMRDALSGVTPLEWRREPLEQDLAGLPLMVLGFGSDVADCPYPTPFRALRRAGMTRLTAQRGNVFDFIYGGREAFLARAGRGQPTSELEVRYAHGALLEELEVWAARAPGGAQPCHGDSGGPVVRWGTRGPELVGVVSWAWHSDVALCDAGAVFAVFDANVAERLADVLAEP